MSGRRWASCRPTQIGVSHTVVSFQPCRHLFVRKQSATGCRSNKSLWLKRNGSEGPKQTIKKAHTDGYSFSFSSHPDARVSFLSWRSGMKKVKTAICCLFISRSLFFFSWCITQSVFRLLHLLNDEYTLPLPAGKDSYCYSSTEVFAVCS